MAEAEVDEEYPKGTKVKCRSRHAVSNILETIHRKLYDTIQTYDFLDNGNKERCQLRFNEIYELALQKNVSIDGRSWEEIQEEEEETSEYEPVDMMKKKHVTVDLMADFDAALVKATRNRKKVLQGNMYQSKLKQQFASELEHLGKIKVQTEDDGVESLANVRVVSDTAVCERLQEAETVLSSLSKSTTGQMQKLQNLEKAMELHKNIGLLKT